MKTLAAMVLMAILGCVAAAAAESFKPKEIPADVGGPREITYQEFEEEMLLKIIEVRIELLKKGIIQCSGSSEAAF